MNRDRGVHPDIYERNERKALGVRTPDLHPARIRLVDAMRAAMGIKASRFLGSMIRQVRRYHRWPSPKQLEIINRQLEDRGMSRVSCPTSDYDRHRRQMNGQLKQSCDAVDELQKARPLKPPGK